MGAETSWAALGEALNDRHGPLGARAARLREVLGQCMGPRPDDLPDLGPPDPAPSLRPIRVAHRARAALFDAAQEVLDGLLAREIERLAPHLGPRVTVLWPDGGLGVHARDPLLGALEAGPGEAAPVILRDVRIYNFGELRSVRPRGEAERLASACDGAGLALTAALDSRRGARGRALLWAAPAEGDAWQIQTLALPSPDEVVCAGRRVSTDEDEAVRVADRAVRHWFLGHTSQLRAMRNHMMANLWVGGALMSAEAFIEARGSTPVSGDASWLVFTGTSTRAAARPVDVIDAEPARALEREAKAAWKRPWPRLQVKWTETEVGRWDAEARAPKDPVRVRCLLVAQDDVDQRDEVSRRWRLAGLFDPERRAP